MKTLDVQNIFAIKYEILLVNLQPPESQGEIPRIWRYMMLYVYLY